MPVSESDIVGYSIINEGKWPLNALRHKNAEEYTGWYIWWGDTLTEDDDFFKPTHLHHIKVVGVDFRPYLALEPGWRWLLAPDFADAWFDQFVAKV